MIEIDFSTALVLYLFAYLGAVLLCWAHYEWKRHGNRGASEKKR